MSLADDVEMSCLHEEIMSLADDLQNASFTLLIDVLIIVINVDNFVILIG